MKTFAALAAVVLSTTTALAVEVQELDLGACWVGEKEAMFPIASFNEGTSFIVSKREDDLPGILDRPQLEKAVTAELKKLRLASHPGGAYDVHLFCSGLGHFFFVNVPSAKLPICAWVKAERNAWKVLQIATNPDGKPGDRCQGADPKKLLVLAKEGVALGALEKQLKTTLGADVAATEQYAPGRFLIVTLAEKHRFGERAVKERIEKDAGLAALVGAVEYNHLSTVVGEGIPLLRGQYSGY